MSSETKNPRDCKFCGAARYSRTGYCSKWCKQIDAEIERIGHEDSREYRLTLLQDVAILVRRAHVQLERELGFAVEDSWRQHVRSLPTDRVDEDDIPF